MFLEEDAKRLPQHQPWDIAIDFIKNAPASLDCKIYPLTAKEQETLDKYIKENLQKGYIRPLKSKYSSPFFFVGKKDGKSRPVVDYRKLNSIMEPDRYPLYLIQELVDKVQNAKLFMKVDVRKGYNNIRVKEGDKHKAAFKTNMGLFEPVVMPFGLRNAPAVFQRMMNTQFSDLVATGKVVIYMENSYRNARQRSRAQENSQPGARKAPKIGPLPSAEQMLFRGQKNRISGRHSRKQHSHHGPGQDSRS